MNCKVYIIYFATAANGYIAVYNSNRQQMLPTAPRDTEAMDNIMSYINLGFVSFVLKALLFIVASGGLFSILKIICGDHGTVDMHNLIKAIACGILILVALCLVAQLNSNKAIAYPVSGHAYEMPRMNSDEKLIAMLQNQLGQ